MSKFHLLCSCTICRKQLTVQSLTNHYNKHQNDLIVKSHCPTCNSPIFTENKFCNQSCAAKFNNAIKDYNAFKPGPPKGYSPINRKNNSYIPHTKIKWCIICGKPHTRKGKGLTCSKLCQSINNSNKMLIRIYNGYNPNENRGRGKQSYLEKSFEEWINTLDTNLKYITEAPFKRLDMIKTYFADFYFPELNLIIELDGSQHNTPKQQEYDRERDTYISQTYNIQIVRISHKEYIQKTRIPEIRAILGIRIPTK